LQGPDASINDAEDRIAQRIQMMAGGNVMSLHRVCPVRILAAAGVACAASIANAQVLDEVVVTAQKREQSISDVGISVTAFSGEQLKALGVSDTISISAQTPGMIVTEFGGGTTTVFNIRGSGQLDFNDQQEAPVAVYLDGAYVSFLAGVGFNIYDLERVEVLRGSQGTLFGRNATGGLVHIISNRPTSTSEGYIELTAGDYGMIKAEGALNAPLSETVSGRLSLFHESNDGFIENSTGADGGDRNNNSGRLQLLFEPSDELSVLVAGRYAIDDAEGQIYDVHAAVFDADGYIQAVAPFGSASDQDFLEYCAGLIAFNGVPGPPGGTAPGSGDCHNGAPNNRDPFHSSTNAPSYYQRDHYGATVTVDYTVGPGTLTSITDYQDFKKRYSEDADSTPLTLWHFQQDLDATQLSQELRYATETSWGRYILGGYYLRIEDDGRASLDAIPTLGISFQNFFGLDTETYAGFGQVEYRLAADFTAIAGFRWTEDRKEFHIDVGCGFDFLANETPVAENCAFFAPLVQGTGLPRTTRDEGNWSGNLELNWTPSDDLLVYGKVVRGHKAGGFNGGIINFFEPSAATYDAELPLTYEAGVKAALFDRKARVSASAFYTDYKDFQTFTQAGANLIVFNVDAEMTGGELELTLNPWEGWDILFGLSLLDATQKDVPGPGGLLDRPMPNAPDVTYNALARYEWSLFGGVMAVQADMTYRDDRSLSAIDHPGLQGDSYSLVNANLAWTSPDGRWDFKVWGKNLGDKVYYHTTFDLVGITGQIEPVVGAPRWYGATLGYRFE
jgi:iron complex outermembrane receptor protein